MRNARALVYAGAPPVRRLHKRVEARQKRIAMDLYNRLWALGTTSGSVNEMLDDHKRELQFVNQNNLRYCVTTLRKQGRFQHALEILEWMKERCLKLSDHDHGEYLYLLSRTNGIAAAEAFFHGLPRSSKNLLTHTSLLNCYCKEKMEDKALSLFEKMDRMGMASTSLAFCHLMNLYMRLNQHQRVLLLAEELKQRRISPTSCTYSAIMHSHACLNDISSVERVVEEMGVGDGTPCRWTIYCDLASIYVKAGLHKKAEFAFKKLEQVMDPRDRKAYELLLSLYAATSNQKEVGRMWNSLKIMFGTPDNASYLVMIQALGKLNDIDGLRKCFEEWESVCSDHDMRLPAAAVGSYLSWDMSENAQRLFHRAISGSSSSGLGTLEMNPHIIRMREMFIKFFLRKGQVELALGHMKEAAAAAASPSSSSGKWLPKLEAVVQFWNCLEQAKNVDSAEKLFNILKEADCLDSRAYESMLRVYAAAGKTQPGVNFLDGLCSN